MVADPVSRAQSSLGPLAVGERSVADRSEDHAARFDRVRHAVVPDARRPEAFEASDETLARVLGVDRVALPDATAAPCYDANATPTFTS
jgi:hypothetical protein